MRPLLILIVKRAPGHPQSHSFHSD